MSSITAHCLVKNEENFIYYAVKSVINFVDKVIIFDTGSTDKTVELIQELLKEYPEKIIFEEKGLCDKVRHTQLRQEMLDRTKTSWFMILDGDEIWTQRGMEEVLKIISDNNAFGCILTPYYLCVGDIFHHSIRGKYDLGKYVGKDLKIHALARIFKITPEVIWTAPYGEDFIKDTQGNLVRGGNYVILKNKFWHASAMVRSSKDSDVSLGRHKQVITYSLKVIGEGLRIKENIPEVFEDADKMRLTLFKSWINAVLLILYGLGIIKNRLWI